MAYHPVTRYLDPAHHLFPEIFDGIEEVWEALPRIAEVLNARLDKPEIRGTLRGSVHIEGPVLIAEGAQVMHGAVLLGPVAIGPGAFIGPGCYIRPNTVIGERAIVGNSCELKNCSIGSFAEVPHWNYVGDSILGHRAHLAAGVVLSNWRHDHASIPVSDPQAPGGRIDTGLPKFGAVIGDHADIGTHAVLNPGSLIGPHSVVYGGVVWRGVLPAGRIVKLRQSHESVERR